MTYQINKPKVSRSFWGLYAKIKRNFEEVIDWHFWLILGVFALLTIKPLLISIDLNQNQSYKQATRGYEYYWIAESIAKGKGFSLSADHRWFFVDFKSDYPDNVYFETALEEPLYTYLLGFAIKYFREGGHFIIFSLQITAVYLTSIFIFLISKRIFSSWIALLSPFLFIICTETWGAAKNDFNPSFFAALLISLAVYLLLKLIDQPRVSKGIVLGIILGLNALNLAGSQFIIPVAAAAILILGNEKKRTRLKTATVVLIMAVVTILPWSVRNFLVFNEVVPIRNGGGLMMHMSNPILAATFTDGRGACVEKLGPLWKARDAIDAIRIARKDRESRFAIYKRGYDCIEREAPPDYPEYNEAKRDKFYNKKAIEYIFEQPTTFLKLSYSRFFLFLKGEKRIDWVMVVLASVSSILFFRCKTVLVIVSAMAAYACIFFLAIPWAPRNRYPIEPLMYLLGSFLPALLVARLFQKLRG